MKNLPRPRSLSLLKASLFFALAFDPVTAGTFGDFTYVDNGTTITITDYDDGWNSFVSIPSSINGKPVTAIGENAFYYSDISSVTIPSSITSIGASAFYRCDDLHRIALPNSIVTVGDLAFFGSGLSSLTIPSSVTTIGNNAFSGCESLTSFSIPSNVTSIGNSAFNDCRYLKSVTIASAALLDGTFIGCYDLKSVTFIGVAPTVMNRPFDGADDSFRVYYYDGMKGFTWPTWQGYPTSPVGAEITIQQPSGSFLVDGTAKKSFGSVAFKKSRTKIFSIKNIGTENLTGFSITKNGTNAKDFLVKKPDLMTLNPGKTATFEITFKPSAKGTRTANIHIKSNDANENPFDIKLTGLGVK